MLDNPPELSPDLEWLLSGTQASEELILDTLVSELLDGVFFLAYSILDNPILAEQVTIQAFVNIIKMRHRYTGAEGVRLFAYRQAIKICAKIKKRRQKSLKNSNPGNKCFITDIPRVEPATEEKGVWLAFDRMAPSLQIPLVLEGVHGFSLHEIAFLTGVNQEKIKAQLRSAFKHLLQAAVPYTANQSAEDFVRGTIRKRWPSIVSTNQVLQALIDEIQMRVYRSRQTDRVNAIYMQATLVGLAVVMLVVIGWITNRMASRETHLPLGAYTVVVTKIVHVPVYVTPTPETELIKVEALTIDSSENEIRQHIENSHKNWQTLWAEALIFQYGPMGYVGPPAVRREQLWINEFGNRLLLSGKSEGGVDRALLSVAAKSYFLDQDGNHYDAEFIQSFHQEPVFNLQRIFPPDEWMRSDMVFTVVEVVNMIGRDALVLDLNTEGGHPKGRVWVDTESGVILGLRIYDQDGITILVDIHLTDLVMNVEIPQKIFSPTAPLLDFTKDYRAFQKDMDSPIEISTIQQMSGHEPYPRVKPPASFDSSRSYLIFQWHYLPVEPSQEFAIVPVDVFAGGYYLGEIPVKDPWFTTCERSSDGSYLAIVEQPDEPPFPAANMRVFDLSDLEISYEPLPSGSIYGNDLAFSPDSQQLAFWGCGGREDNCGVYLLDMLTHKLVKLLPGSYAGYFVWSPDGEELAMLRSSDKLVIVDATTGQIISEQSFNWALLELLGDSSLTEWGIPFAPNRKGLRGCELPGR